MFRDGVGDGQLPVVRDYEVPQFYNLFKRIKTDYDPKLTYIVVQKRINTRLYMKQVRILLLFEQLCSLLLTTTYVTNLPSSPPKKGYRWHKLSLKKKPVKAVAHLQNI